MPAGRGYQLSEYRMIRKTLEPLLDYLEWGQRSFLDGRRTGNPAYHGYHRKRKWWSSAERLAERQVECASNEILHLAEHDETTC